MQYPRVLLPSPGYKKIEIDLSQHHICRTTPNTAWIATKNQGIPESVFYTDWKEFFDYSTNLPGHFKLEHNFLVLIGEHKKNFYQPWDFSSDVGVPLYKEDFDIDKTKGWFFLPIKEIHKKLSLPITSNPVKQDDKITAEVIHTPTCSNFWHFSIQWKDSEGNPVSPSKSKWKELIIGTMRAKLTQYIITSTPDIFVLTKESFCQTDN